MKTILPRSVTVAAGSATTVTTQPGDIVFVGQRDDITYAIPAQGVSVGNLSPVARTFFRGLRLTNEALYCFRAGTEPLAIDISSLVKIIMAANPAMSAAPTITYDPDDKTCDGTPSYVDFTAAADSELDPLMFVWRESTVAGGTSFGNPLTKGGIYDPGVQAAGTLTSNNTNVTAGNFVIVAGKMYRFVSTTPDAEGDVLVGSDADGTLTNLKDAINRDSPGTKDGVKYRCENAHPFVTCGAVTAHAVTVTAIGGGTGPNSLPTTTNDATLSWGADTLEDGEASEGGEGALRITPSDNSKTGFNYICSIHNLAGFTYTNAAKLTVTLA